MARPDVPGFRRYYDVSLLADAGPAAPPPGETEGQQAPPEAEENVPDGGCGLGEGSYGKDVVDDEEQQIYRTLEETVNEDKYQEFYHQHRNPLIINALPLPPPLASAVKALRPPQGQGKGGVAAAEQGPAPPPLPPPVVQQGAPGRGAGGGGRWCYPSSQDEDIYEDLCSFRRQLSRTHLSHVPRAVPHLAQPKEKRDYCMKELVETEGNYVEVLGMLRKNFIKPLKDVMREQDRKVVFKHIVELGEIHTTFYNDLVDALVGKSQKLLGEVFLDFKLRFLLYGDYCSDLPTAQQTLDSLCVKVRQAFLCIISALSIGFEKVLKKFAIWI